MKAIQLSELYLQENQPKLKLIIMMEVSKMKKIEIVEMPNFEYTPQGFKELKTVLKARKIIKNPFAKFYSEKIEVTVVQDADKSCTNQCECPLELNAQ